MQEERFFDIFPRMSQGMDTSDSMPSALGCSCFGMAAAPKSCFAESHWSGISDLCVGSTREDNCCRHTVGRLHLPSAGSGSRAGPSGCLRFPLVSAFAMVVNIKPQVTVILS